MSLAVAGQTATSHAASGDGWSCPSRGPVKRFVLLDRFSQGETRPLTQRVALALLNAVLLRTCS